MTLTVQKESWFKDTEHSILTERILLKSEQDRAMKRGNNVWER